MVDTVVIRIHNLVKYPELIDYLNKAHQNKGTSVKEIENSSDYSCENQYLKLYELAYNDTNKRTVKYFNKEFLPSSHYYLSYFIDSYKNFIEFNFSIPKYLYGTNIVQFVPHFIDSKISFNRFEANGMDFNVESTYKRLNVFLKQFIKQFDQVVYNVGNEPIQTLKVDPSDVEINRLDLCFNQYFIDKQEALRYLNAQKRIRKKHIRDTSNNKTDWQSSIFIQTDNYVAKIYHKGTEYNSKAGEKKHHQRINKKAGREVFDTDFLQEQSDRILRYEISFKRPYMSYLFKKKIFRKDCKIHQHFKEVFLKMDALITKEKRRWKKHNEAQTDEIKQKALSEIKEVEKELKEYRKQTFSFDSMVDFDGEVGHYCLTHEQIHRIFRNMESQTNEFYLGVQASFGMFNRETILLNIKRDDEVSLYKSAKFSRALLSEMFTVFRDFMNQFYISDKIDAHEIAERVREHNRIGDILSDKGKAIENLNRNKTALKKHFKSAKSTISEKNMMKTIALLDLYTLDEMEKFQLISKTTKNEIKRKFKMLGFDHKNIQGVRVATALDFTAYHDMIISNPQKFILRNAINLSKSLAV